jgi:hypothetical protein
MDRSETGTEDYSQGDEKLFEQSLKVLGGIKPGSTPLEQVRLLNRILACANSWCPVSKWGIKKISEQMRERERTYFSPSAEVTYIGLQDKRVAPIIAPTHGSDDLLYYRGNGRQYFGVFLFVAEDCSIIALTVEAEDIGDEILPAHKIIVECATEEFLVDLIAHKGSYGNNQHLACFSLCLCLRNASLFSRHFFWQIGN